MSKHLLYSLKLFTMKINMKNIISARLATKKERQDYEQHTGF